MNKHPYLGDEFRPIEDLLGDAAFLPMLSSGLRRRVLAAARHARRILLMQQAALTVIIFGLVCFATGSSVVYDQNIANDFACEQRTFVESHSTHDAFPGLNSLIAMSDVGSWEHVEAVNRLRYEHLKLLRRAL